MGKVLKWGCKGHARLHCPELNLITSVLQFKYLFLNSMKSTQDLSPYFRVKCRYRDLTLDLDLCSLPYTTHPQEGQRMCIKSYHFVEMLETSRI